MFLYLLWPKGGENWNAALMLSIFENGFIILIVRRFFNEAEVEIPT